MGRECGRLAGTRTHLASLPFLARGRPAFCWVGVLSYPRHLGFSRVFLEALASLGKPVWQPPEGSPRPSAEADLFPGRLD